MRLHGVQNDRSAWVAPAKPRAALPGPPPGTGPGCDRGYLLRENLWLSVGFNATGFSDVDLSSDYTARGAYIRLRFKFDKDLFAGSDKSVNRALDR